METRYSQQFKDQRRVAQELAAGGERRVNHVAIAVPEKEAAMLDQVGFIVCTVHMVSPTTQQLIHSLG